ncbi:MAG: 3-dehydroquinate synthase [Streptomycetaceae bacterium]|nr:MAG: 3-dehydroquinate synthase [Streptomycetaceae bacterium]
MSTISVNAEKKYEVLVDCNWREALEEIAQSRTRVGIVVSASLRERLGDISLGDCDVHLFEVIDGEGSKSAENVQLMWDWLGAGGFTRNDVLVAVGGGATTDVAGFAAATWLRGIDWIAVPTTLAGMVDASVGGKTGMNSSFGKNLIGAFHSPSAVLIDCEWLSTLSDRDFSAGMAEVVKCGFIADPKILDIVENNSLAEIRSSRALTTELIERSVRVKASVVSEDFKESFAREILNYGHTLGHAVELHSNYSLRHGEAVSIGMVFAAELAGATGHLSDEIVARHRSILASLNLPISYARDAWAQLLPLLYLDKKSRGRQLRFVGISDIGKTFRVEEVSTQELTQTYERISE